ncbi:MAG: 50S ribosomal protein L1 [Candidatus Pacebacteria bacterium GW2011_GWF2_38_9]|nr:MAG: 50S ribosomal protein L1, large subunit ribosomal protein L1 [candidate division TM6 bacterium GW2011_GWF2_28_16]KKQ07298.1 MAG: 50S ribosomal protein L1 [Candidatus Pacebacteria bacterium GW2011_GWF1_36_5]KKQ89186.1 MAG: 50S ribosomal protein L1 [Candidatus Pacebacteria bacterium GW2011_GWF2_38_9]HAZ73758.1 50S ribosomal protein L1 [Candidatus Paceibacterota bacterium]
MGSKKNVDMSATETEIKVVEATEVKEETDSQGEAKVEKKITKAKKVRGKKYQAVRSQLDKSKFYTAKEAVELVKKLSYTKFVGSVEAHIVVREIGDSVNIALPHSTGKSVKVTVVDAQVLSDIEAGKIDFDILVAAPEFMPKLARFAKVLGPKGLMPNPKSGTLTPNPELKKKELEAGKFSLKTEKKAPLMHLIIGKTDMKSADLLANIEALVKALKGKILKLSIAASMSPGVKVLVEESEE